MARISKATDYTLPVDGVGSFVFGRRTMRDELDIQREYAVILGGAQPTPMLDLLANWISVFKVLTVLAPDGWDLDTMDPLDDETYEKMRRVYDAIAEKEASFRRKPAPGSQGSGA